jgi:hypothetical protein
VSDPSDLKRKAAQYRRLANIPTAGGRETDRILKALAEQVEGEATKQTSPTEAHSQAKPASRSGGTPPGPAKSR